MSERIEIHFNPGEGAVLRMLGLIERRGFAVSEIAMTSTAHGGSLTVDVEPRDPSRRLDVMARQLGRLVEVQSVAVKSQNSGISA